MCHLYQSAKWRANQKIDDNVFEIKGKKQSQFWFVGREKLMSPLKAPAQVRDYDYMGGGGIFALKRMNAVMMETLFVF